MYRVSAQGVKERMIMYTIVIIIIKPMAIVQCKKTKLML